MIKDEPDGEDTQSQDELDELRKNVQGTLIKFKFVFMQTTLAFSSKLRLGNTVNLKFWL